MRSAADRQAFTTRLSFIKSSRLLEAISLQLPREYGKFKEDYSLLFSSYLLYFHFYSDLHHSFCNESAFKWALWLPVLSED